LRKGNWVFIPPYPGPRLFGDKNVESGNSKFPQLYDLSSDISQQKNLVATESARVLELQIMLKSIRERRTVPSPK
jgi:hypothetical protein